MFYFFTEIRLFCSGTTIALSAVYILQFFILCPTLYLTRRFERKSKLNARWVNNNENSHCHQRQDGIVKHDSTDCHKSVVEFVENGVSGDGSSFVFSSAAVKTDTLRLSCGACLKNWVSCFVDFYLKGILLRISAKVLKYLLCHCLIIVN